MKGNRKGRTYGRLQEGKGQVEDIEKGGTREGCRKGDRWKGWGDKWKDEEKRVTGARM